VAPSLTRWSPSWLLVLLIIGAVGCAPQRLRPPRSQAAAPRLLDEGGWQTLRAEHRVLVETRGERRVLRGVIAVARPDRFRLRALGPGGITLFDVAWVGGQVRLLSSLQAAAPGSLLDRLIGSVAGDLAAAYDLAPRPPGRQVRLDGHAVIIQEPERQLRLTHFRSLAGKVYPQEMIIDNLQGGYRVQVTAGETALDEALDPGLFPQN
jgi:hypothetical protein